MSRGRPKLTSAQLRSEAAKLERELAQIEQNMAGVGGKAYMDLETRIAKLRKQADERADKGGRK